MSKNVVTLSPDLAASAMNTLVYADTVLFNLLPNSFSAANVREELLALRRAIALQYNATSGEPAAR